jgi:putative transposase
MATSDATDPLVEQHRIQPADPRFAVIDAAAFASKHLYNKALYVTRQAFFHDGSFPSYPALYHQMKSEPAYATLPRKVAQWVLKQVCAAWDSHRQGLVAYEANPSDFLGPPRIPHYLEKHGRNLLVYTMQALSQPGLRAGRIEPSGLGIRVPTKQTRIRQVRLVPRAGYYIIQVVYERDPRPAPVNPALYASVDVGVNVLAAIASNQQGFVPRLVNGRPIKSINQFYNKRRAELQAALGHPGTTRRLARLAIKRNDRINHYLHTASRRIIDLLVAESIGTLVVGKNPLWKQGAHIGRVNNQHFVQLPHARFIDLLTYKAQLMGIQVVVQEESYTSKASFLDGDPLPDYDSEREEKPRFSGRRVQRGLYRASTGRRIHADVNGSYNLGRKAFPNSFGQGIEAVVVRPTRLAV